MDVIAFVHAKGTSTRVPAKNKRLLGDIPLFCHAIKNALASKLVTKVVIDSDNADILRIGQELGAEPLKRDSSLANNSTTGDDLMYWQASNYPNSDIVLQVIPTAPFIKPQSIDEAISRLCDTGVNSVFGAYKEALYTWSKGTPDYYKKGKILNSFDLTPIEYETTGLYINKTDFVLRDRKRLDCGSYSMFFLSKLESFDINTEEDFKLAEILYRGML